MPFFSVITPLYNKQGYIATTLQSALAQTFTDFEIIIVNDGSTDDSEAVLKTFADNRIVYIKTVNRGVSWARNTGIENSKGKIIAFLDADDDWLPNHLQVLYDLHCRYPNAGMYASRYYYNLPGNKLQKTPLHKINDHFSGIVPDFFESSLKYRIAFTSALAVPKEIFGIVGLFNVGYTNSEDTDMWIRIGIKYPVALSGEYTAAYNYYIENSLSKNSLHAQKLMDFSQYKQEEKTNNGLKQFLDLYRLEYAVKYRIQGSLTLSNALLKEVAPDNIGIVQGLLLNLPPAILRTLLFVKKSLYNVGIVKV